MNEIQVPLTEDEAACLMIMKEGAPLVAMEFSRWDKPIKTLAKRGLCAPRMMLGGGAEYVITDAGHVVCEAWENQSLRDVITANNNVAERREFNIDGFTARQVKALADFYWKMTGRNPSEICPP